LPAKHGENFEQDIGDDCKCRRPPDDWVAEKINLTVVLAPEVDASSKDRPGGGARIPGVRLNETRVSLPHDFLEFPELAKEARATVIDLLDVFTELRMVVLLDVPDAVRQGAAFCAGDFLLLETPVWQFDFVRKQDTARHDMDEFELCLNGSESLLGRLTVRHGLDDLHSEHIVSITFEALVTISGNLLLPVCFGDWGPLVVRV